MKQKTVAPEASVWERIKTKQSEINELYREAVANVYKETEGSAFLGEDNLNFAGYWLKAVTENPQVMNGLYNLEDFKVKYGFFAQLIEAYNGDNAGRAILDTPYDIASQDVFRYAMDAKTTFDRVAEVRQEFRQIVKDAPQYRKVKKVKSPLATVPEPVAAN